MATRFQKHFYSKAASLIVMSCTFGAVAETGKASHAIAGAEGAANRTIVSKNSEVCAAVEKAINSPAAKRPFRPCLRA